MLQKLQLWIAQVRQMVCARKGQSKFRLRVAHFDPHHYGLIGRAGLKIDQIEMLRNEFVLVERDLGARGREVIDHAVERKLAACPVNNLAADIDSLAWRA